MSWVINGPKYHYYVYQAMYKLSIAAEQSTPQLSTAI